MADAGGLSFGQGGSSRQTSFGTLGTPDINPNFWAQLFQSFPFQLVLPPFLIPQSTFGFNNPWFGGGGGGWNFGGGGGGYPSTSGGSPPAPAQMPDWMRQQYQNNQASGRSWDSQNQTWKEVTGHPQILWDASTNTNYWGATGEPLSPQQMQALARGGSNTFQSGGGGGGPQTFGMNDLVDAYNRVDPQKAQDIARVFRSQGLDPNRQYTADELARAFQGARWMSGRSQGNAMNLIGDLQSLGYLREAGGGTPFQGFGGGTFLGEGGMFGGGGRAPAGPPMPDWMSAQIANNQATGRSWQQLPSGQWGWAEVTGRPDVTWDSNTNTTYYRGQAVSPQQLQALMQGGPQAIGGMNEGQIAANTWLQRLTQLPDFSLWNPKSLPMVQDQGQLTPMMAGAPPMIQPLAGGWQSLVPDWMPAPGKAAQVNTRLPQLPQIPGVQQLGQGWRPRNISVENVPYEQASRPNFTSPEAQTQMGAMTRALSDPQLEQVNTAFNRSYDQMNAQLAASGMAGSPAGVANSLGRIVQDHQLQVAGIMRTTSDTALAQYGQQEQQRLQFNTEMAARADTQNQQMSYQIQAYNSQVQLQMIRDEYQRRQFNSTLAAQDVQNLQRVREFNAGMDQWNAGALQQMNLANMGQQIQIYDSIQNAKLTAAGIDFAGRERNVLNLMTMKLADTAAWNQMLYGSADLRQRGQMANLQAYANALGIDSNLMLGVRNQGLQTLQALQQERGLNFNEAMQGVITWAQSMLGYLSIVGNIAQRSVQRQESKGTGGSAFGISGDDLKALAGLAAKAAAYAGIGTGA